MTIVMTSGDQPQGIQSFALDTGTVGRFISDFLIAKSHSHQPAERAAKSFLNVRLEQTIPLAVLRNALDFDFKIVEIDSRIPIFRPPPNQGRRCLE